ncbi:MAG: hypothetical protein ABI854_11025, partial [Betaproteobacteria bacterium]
MDMTATPRGANDPIPYVGLPPQLKPSLTATRHYFQALDNFFRVFAIRAGERVLMLTDPLLDTRVVDAIAGLAKARGATLSLFMAPTTTLPRVPDEVQPLLKQADFVVSTWFCSIEDPFNVALRRAGQRWVKITYFRDLDLLMTPQARFPIDVVGEILRATERSIPKGDFVLRFSDERGSDLSIPYTAAMRESMFSGNRWRGKMVADEPGCYVHYLPTHGPNFWDSTAMKTSPDARISIDGILYPQWAIGFAQPFAERIAVVFNDNRVTEVRGESTDARILRDMLLGGRIIEGGGCGFNPKAPRYTVYPAGSNSPGALHFGVDLARPSDYIRRVMPDWDEPP